MDALLHVFTALEPNPLRSAHIPLRADEPAATVEPSQIAPQERLLADSGTAGVGDFLEET
jgi:hypothetical protein